MKRTKGFTIIELLVVIGIIALLASVVLLALNAARVKARDARRLADVKQMSTAFELYNNDMGGYPDTETAMIPAEIGSVPIAPLPIDGTCTSAQNTYTYTPSGTSFLSAKDGVTTVWPTFTYTFCLGKAVENLAAGVHTLSPGGIQ